MRDPLQRLKYLPWLELFQVAALTTVIVTVLDIALFWMLTTVFSRASFIFGSFGVLTHFFAAIGMGALAVFLLERFFRQIYINGGILWALASCLAVVLFAKSYFIVPFLARISYLHFLGILLGVSVKGRRYWR